jgi:hypothetical protein
LRCFDGHGINASTLLLWGQVLTNKEAEMFCVGMDLGQRKDYTAIAVVERRDMREAFQRTALHSIAVRHVERLPLGTPYAAVVRRVREIVQSDALRGDCSLTVDATGLGAPVMEMLRAGRLGCEICAVTITGGEREHANGSGTSVPKRDLIAEVQTLLERGELRIARDLKGARMLLRELMDVQARAKSNGGVRVGADGSGEHDDLVIALALGCWKAKRRRDLFGAGRLTGI